MANKQYDKQNFLIHDYFFAKTLDKVRPDGVVAFVTSKGTMDKESPEVRKYLAQRAAFLGAVRLPNTAFKEDAGTLHQYALSSVWYASEVRSGTF